MRFPALKSTLVGFGFLFIVLFLLFSSVGALLEVGSIGAIFTFVIAVAATWLLNSLWTKTYYTIENENLLYRSGPLKGRILISSIRKIKLNKKFAAYGLRPALSLFGGMLIRYGKWGEIYVAPADKDLFVSELLIRNPDIVIEE